MPDTFDEIESRFGAKKPAADFDAIEARFGKASAQDSFAADAAAEEALWAEDAAYPAMQRAKAAEEAAAAEFQRRAHAKTAGYKPPTFVERVGREALTLGQEGLDAGETAVRDLWAEAQAIPALIEGPARYQAARAQAHAADREKPTLTRALQDLDPTGGEAKARAASLAGLEGDTSGRLLLGGARLSGEVAALGPAGKAVGMVPTFTARAAAGAAPGDELKAALTTAATLIVGGKVAQGLSQVFPKIPVGLRPALAGAVEDARQAAIAGVAFGGVEAGRRAVTGEDQDAEAIAHAAGLGAFIVAAEGGGAGAARKAYVERYMAAKAEQVQRAGIRADVRRQMGEIDQRNADLRGVRDEMRAAVPKAALPAAPERPALTEGDGSIPAEVVRKTTYEETPQTPENVRAGQRVTPGAEVVPIGPRSGKPTKARRPTPELTVEQAGAVKAEALRLGLATEAEVISPERAKALMAALEAGATPQDAMQIVKDLGPVTRADGNVAEGYKPTAEVLADPAIPEAQKAAIKAAQEQGIATASSHVAEDGTGVAIGVDGQGRVRRVEAEAPKGEPTPEVVGASDRMMERLGGMAEDLLSGSAVMEPAQERAVRRAWALLARAGGRLGSNRENMEDPGRHTTADLRDAMRIMEEAHTQHFGGRRGAVRPALPEGGARLIRTPIQAASATSFGGYADGTPIRFGKNGEPIEGEIGGLPVTTERRGLIDQMSPKTVRALEEAFSDPDTRQALEDAGIHTVHLADNANRNRPTGWTMAHKDGVLWVNPQTAERMAKRDAVRGVQRGILGVLHHEAGHGLWKRGTDAQRRAVADALAAHPEVVKQIEREQNTHPPGERFDDSLGSAERYRQEEVHAELNAIRRYNPERFAALPEQVRTAIEAFGTSGDPALGDALKKYGPQAPEKGTTLGVGLGAIPKGAADLPRNILNVPGKIIDPIVERGLDALGGLVGRGLRKIPGAGTVSGWWSARRNIQEVFAKQSGETEAAALDTSAATKAVAKATRAPEQQEAAYGYVTEPNSPVARAKAEKAIGPEGVKTIDAALDIRDTNQRFIEDHNLVGKEAKRVYGAQVGKRGTYLRREYANVEDEVYDHLLLLQGKGAKLPKNELKRDKWTVTWGAKEYRKFDTEAEARSFKKINGHGEVVAPLSPEARKQMGEVTDPAVVLQRTLALQALKIARFKTLEAFAKGPLASDKPGDPRFAAEPIPNDPTRYGPLAGKYVDKALRAEVMGRFGEVEALDKFFDIIERGGSWWKAGKTIYNPASQGGNIIGNIAFLERAGVSLARPSDLPHLANAIRLQFAKPGTAEWALLREFTRNGFGASASIPADLQGALLEAASVRNGQGMVRRIAAVLARAPRAAWMLGDTIPKTAAALKVLRNGGTMEQAVQVVRDSFPDYGRAWSGLLTNSRTRTARAIKAVFAPPFVNFLSESVRIGAGTAKSKSGSLATGLLVLKALGLLSQQAAGISDEEAEKTIALAPDWMRAGSLAAPLWWDRDEKGNAQVVDLRYVLPLSREMGDLFGTGDARQSGLSIVNNPILAPLEDVFTNRDRFFGEPLTKPGASVEEKREQAGRYLFDAYAPSLATKFSGFGRRPGTSYRALTGTKDRYGQVPEVSSALMGDLAGVRVRPIDEGVEWARYRTALGARVREKVDAIRAADRRGDHDEVERLARDLRALDAEWKAKRKAVGK